jgi:RNA polymerase sigma-70 factor, ECF subfamily
VLLPILNPSDAPDGPPDIDALYRLHGPMVARWAARLGGPAIDVDDVVQEVFVVARRRLRAVAGPAKVTTWLFRATQRIVLAARRKARRRQWLSRMPPDLAPLLPRPRPTPLEAVERQETAAAVYALLDRLSERQRRVLILFEMEGMSTDEIATLTGARHVSVRVQLHRARGRFRALFDEWEKQ